MTMTQRSSMRAAVVRNGSIGVEALPVPEPGPGEVLVRTLACGICGSDLHLFKHGAAMMRLAERLGAIPDNLTDGLVMGHEFVAGIVRFGADTRRQLNVGDRVCAVPFLTIDGRPVSIGASSRTVGAYAEYFLLNEAGLIRIPDNVPTEAAALTEPLAIGVHAVAKSNAQPRDTAVVIGCGPIGLACIAVLKLRGVKRIVAADLSAKRRDLAKRFGADEVVDARQHSPFDTVGPTEATVVFECVGAPGMIDQIVKRAPVGACVVVAGICSQEDAFVPMLAVAKELCFQFVSFYRPDEFETALKMLANGDIEWRAWVTATVPLERVAEAFEALQHSDRHAKILIIPPADTPAGTGLPAPPL
jgi:threonine dehydrogenase-like Zn-dependent dehydrogenase